MPVYYVSAPDLDEPARRDADELARVLALRQFVDWRELRFEPFTSPVVRKTIAQLANRMRDTFWRPPFAVSARTEESGRPTGSKTETAESPASTVTAKTEPPTHVVDPYERGDYVTVAAAIVAAKPGDRILVRPGLYQGGLVIDKPLEILGDGPAADIEIQASDTNALLFKANIGRIANLTLRQVGGKVRSYCVNITQGRLELEGCDITSQSLACVAIHNGADPRLRNNTIHDGKQSGVFVYDNGLGTLEDNDINANARGGVAIRTGGNPTLRRNTIHDGKQSGVFVYDNGLGTLEDNDINANARGGVAIRTGGNPTLRRNTIHDGKQSGVFVYDNGLGTLEDNNISANASGGVAIKTGGNPTLRHNTIHNEKQSGVFVYDNGLGTLEDNDISANGEAGVETKTGGKPTVRGNRINRNTLAAVWIYETGQGVFEDNDLTDNGQGAWDIAPDSEENVERARNRE